MIAEGLGQYIDEWCAGKTWWWRALVLLVFVHQWMNHLSDPLYAGFFSGISLGIHEGGHLLFRPFGEWLMVAGGTIAQVAAPIISAVLFFRQPDFFAISVCGCWLADTLFDVSTYMGDATALELDVVTVGGGEPITPNDWRYLLESVHLLLWDQRLAHALRLFASLVMIASLGFGVWLFLKMRQGKTL